MLEKYYKIRIVYILLLYLPNKNIRIMKFIKNLKTLFVRIISNEKVIDSGMRTDSSGNIYVDNKVFFERKEVKDKIDKLIKNHELINK